MMLEDPMISYSSPKKPLSASLILHDEGDKLERKAYIEDFKKRKSVDVLIVNQMLLTGFDAPGSKSSISAGALTDTTCCRRLHGSIVHTRTSNMAMWLILSI